jgi:hypothetical protein
MGSQAPDTADLDFQVGDHVCAFYNEGDNVLDDIVVAYLSKGLQAGNKCAYFNFADAVSSVRDRIPSELMSRGGSLQFFTEDEMPLPEGGFSKETYLRGLEAIVKEGLSDGYDRVWVIGDTTFVARQVDSNAMKAWFTWEAEVVEFAPRYPQFIMCLYDLNRYAGELIMSVLRTHPRIFVNGLVLNNPYYVPLPEFLESL